MTRALGKKKSLLYMSGEAFVKLLGTSLPGPQPLNSGGLIREFYHTNCGCVTAVGKQLVS